MEKLDGSNFFLSVSNDFDFSKINPRNVPISNYILEGRFDLRYKNVTFKCFFKPSSTKRLFVFFSSADRRENGVPIFHRITWSNKINASCLYIDDPMYDEYKDILCGWYYGNDKVSYLQYIVEIVEHEASRMGVLNEDILFLGSSSGGYAALYCSSRIMKSKAYAFNPQIEIEKWELYVDFRKKIDFKIDSKDFYKRKDINYIFDNLDSKFFIHCNQSSKSDMIQIEQLKNKLDVLSGKIQLNNNNNIYLVIQDIPVESPHNCTADKDDFLIALNVLYEEIPFSSSFIKSYFDKSARLCVLEERIYFGNFWIDFLSKISYSVINKPEINFSSKTNFTSKTSNNLFYRVISKKNKETLEYIFYIDGHEYIKNHISLTLLKEYCFSKKLNLRIFEDRGFIRISKTVMKSADIFKAFDDFVILANESFLIFFK